MLQSCDRQVGRALSYIHRKLHNALRLDIDYVPHCP